MVDNRVRGPNKRAGEKGPNRPGSSGEHFDGPRKLKYLSALVRTGLSAIGRKEANVCRATVDNHLESDPAFAEACREAVDQHRAKIEAKIMHLGVEGYKKAIYWDGAVVGHETVHDSKLLIAYARRHIKEYRESIHVDQHSHHSGGIAVGLADLNSLSRKGRELLRELLLQEGAGSEGKAGEDAGSEGKAGDSA